MSKDNKKEEGQTPEIPTPEVKTPEVETNEKALELMKELGVTELYENKKGEYFTDLSLAVLSENGKVENVKTYK